MCSVHFTISAPYRKEVERHLKTAQHLGRMRQVKYLLAVLAVIDGQSVAQVACGLARAREDRGHMGPHILLLWSPGRATDKAHRPPTATDPNPKAALAALIEEGPVKAGCSGPAGARP